MRQVGDELVVLDQSANKVHQLNTVASLVMVLCDGNHTTEGIVDQVIERYEVDRVKAEHDVRGLLAHFAELGLLASDSQ